MAKLKFTIHPLFFAFGMYFALIGKVFSFLIFVLTAVIHEFGHYLASERYGYKLNRIVLMPYGAVITGENSALKYRDEIMIAFFGPFVNFLIVIFCTAIWWLKPEIYAYTDTVVTANLAVGMVNLLPCYPLDGGRILIATLSLYMPRKIATKVCKIIGMICSLCLLVLFIYSCFNTVNITLLFFSLFVLTGVLSKTERNNYVRICDSFLTKRFDRGVEVKKLAISGKAQIKELYRLTRDSACDISILSANNSVIKTLDFISVQKLLEQANIYDKIEDCIDSVYHI